MREPTVKLHNEIINLITSPKNSYNEQWGYIDWSLYSENDIADTFNYWILECQSNNLGKCQMLNMKNATVYDFTSDYILVPGRFYLIYSPDKEKEILWYKEIDIKNVDKVNVLLSHLYNLWYNQNLPLKIEKLTKINDRKLNQKRKMQEKLFNKMGYYMNSRWPNWNSKLWMPKPKNPSVLKF